MYIEQFFVPILTAEYVSRIEKRAIEKLRGSLRNEGRKKLEVKAKFDFELLLLVNKYYTVLSAQFIKLIKYSVDYIGKGIILQLH